MEHIIQFAIGIDDDRIVKLVEDNASKQIIGDLKQQVANRIFSAYYCGQNANPSTDKLSDLSVQIVSDFLKDNKDVINFNLSPKKMLPITSSIDSCQFHLFYQVFY